MSVGLFYPLSKYTSAPHCSLFSLSRCSADEESTATPSFKLILPAGLRLAGRALCPEHLQHRASRNPGALGAGMSPGAMRGRPDPSSGRTGPPRASTTRWFGHQHGPGTATRARALPPQPPRQRVSYRQGGCLWDGLFISFVLRSVGFPFSVVSDEVCRTPVHLLSFLSKHPHSPCQGRDRLAWP